MWYTFWLCISSALEIWCLPCVVSHFSSMIVACPVTVAWVVHNEWSMCIVYYNFFFFPPYWGRREWIDGKVSFSFIVEWNLLFNMFNGQVSFSFFCPMYVSKTCHTSWCNQQSAHRRPCVWNSRSFCSLELSGVGRVVWRSLLSSARIVLSRFQRGCCFYFVRITFSQNSQGIMYLLIWNTAKVFIFSFGCACYSIAA